MSNQPKMKREIFKCVSQKKIAFTDSYVSLCVFMCMNEFVPLYTLCMSIFAVCVHVIVCTCECVHEGSVASLGEKNAAL